MRVKERHRGEEELQEGCVSFRASEGRGKGATHLSCIRGEQAVVRGQTGTWPRPEKEKRELQQEVSWKDEGGSGKDQRCPGREANEMFDFASQKCSWGQTLLRWGGCGMRQPPPAPSQTLGHQRSASPWPKGVLVPSLNQQTPELSFSVLCEALPTPHLPRARGASSDAAPAAPRASKCPQREAPRCQGVKPSELGLNCWPQCAAPL